jgi:hypothetical protein
MSGTYLTKIENRTFDAQTIVVSGWAFVNCRFVNCTIVLGNGPGVLDRCGFTNCNWYLNLIISPGEPSTRKMLRTLLDQIDSSEGGDSVSFSAN